MRYALLNFVILILFFSLLALCGCATGDSPWHRCETSADCDTGELCPAQTGICSPACSEYDECYGMGLDATCFYFEDGPACAFNCLEEMPNGFSCNELVGPSHGRAVVADCTGS